MDRRARRAVLSRLVALEAIAARAGAKLSAPVGRKHTQVITEGWRELLIQHQVDATGRCPVCAGWLRRRRWPCEMWVTAHRRLIGDSAGSERATRNSNPFCRPRQVEVVPRQPGPPTVEQTATDRPSARHR